MVMSDHTSGLIAAQCIGFALYRREKTGKRRGDRRADAGEHGVVRVERASGRRDLRSAGRPDRRRPPAQPRTTGRCRPRTATSPSRPNTNAQAFAFFDAIGRPELKTDPRFDSAASRTKNAAAYFEVRKAGLAQKTTDEWVELFDKLDVPAARYNSIDDLLTDPHLKDVGFFKEEDHPSEGSIRRTRPANTFSGGAREDESHAPLMGEQTREILAEAGYARPRSTRCWRPALRTDSSRTAGLQARA